MTEYTYYTATDRSTRPDTLPEGCEYWSSAAETWFPERYSPYSWEVISRRWPTPVEPELEMEWVWDQTGRPCDVCHFDMRCPRSLQCRFGGNDGAFLTREEYDSMYPSWEQPDHERVKRYPIRWDDEEACYVVVFRHLDYLQASTASDFRDPCGREFAGYQYDGEGDTLYDMSTMADNYNTQKPAIRATHAVYAREGK